MSTSRAHVDRGLADDLFALTVAHTRAHLCFVPELGQVEIFINAWFQDCMTQDLWLGDHSTSGRRSLCFVICCYVVGAKGSGSSDKSRD